MKNWSVIAMLSLVPAISFAQVASPALVLGEPLQYTNAGKFTGCGLHLKIIEDTKAWPREYLTLSLNWKLGSEHFVLAKYTYGKLTFASTPVPRATPLQSAWVRQAGLDAPTPIKILKGDNDAVLHVLSPSEGIDLMASMLDAETQFQIGYKPDGAAVEKIFYGNVSAEESGKREVLRCFNEMMQRIKGD